MPSPVTSLTVMGMEKVDGTGLVTVGAVTMTGGVRMFAVALTSEYLRSNMLVPKAPLELVVNIIAKVIVAMAIRPNVEN